MKEYTRLESDSIGEMEIPENAYYGVQSLRARENFPITGAKLHPVFIKNLARIKRAAAITNRAIEMLCGKKGDYTIIHPNDHVNMAQSTNDVIPTAGKLTVLDLLKPLDKSLLRLSNALYQKADEFDDVIKIGRTQLENAVPMRLGQSFHAYATMISRDRDRLMKIRSEMYTVNMGATAIGTAINTSSFYLANIVPTLARITGYPLTQADDLFDSITTLTHAVDTLELSF